MRQISCTYEDPLDLIWIQTAQKFGMTVERDPTVFASWNGQGVLRIGTPETLDPDDCLAQMIFHETCHALVEGPDAWNQPDWGLDINNPSQRVHEHACLRLQAALADGFGLRKFFAATTNFRKYYDQLSENPLEGEDDPAIEMARAGMQRAKNGPWSEPIDGALRMTASIAKILAEIAPPNSIWARSQPES